MDNATNTIGLLFTGGDGPTARQILSIVEEARSRCGSEPVLAAADSGLLLVQKAGLDPHWIIGDMDSVNSDNLRPYPPETILTFPKAKDFTDTELALSHLSEKGCKRIWIIGGGGGRIDHLFALRSLFEREQIPERWITSAEDIHCLEAQTKLNTQTNGNISVFPLGDGPWEAESTGLRWPLAGLPWTRGFFGISNEAPSGDFTITVKKGRFLVVLPL